MNTTEFAPTHVEPSAGRNRTKKTTRAPALPLSKPVAPAPVVAKEPELELPGPGSCISDRTMVIVAKINVGWGNTVYIRGEGGNLSWDVGVPMISSGDDRWVWSYHADDAPRQFKFLRNDRDWAVGENEVVSGSDITVCSPGFPD